MATSKEEATHITGQICHQSGRILHLDLCTYCYGSSLQGPRGLIHCRNRGRRCVSFRYRVNPHLLRHRPSSPGIILGSRTGSCSLPLNATRVAHGDILTIYLGLSPERGGGCVAHMTVLVGVRDATFSGTTKHTRFWDRCGGTRRPPVLGGVEIRGRGLDKKG